MTVTTVNVVIVIKVVVVVIGDAPPAVDLVQRLKSDPGLKTSDRKSFVDRNRNRSKSDKTDSFDVLF